MDYNHDGSFFFLEFLSLANTNNSNIPLHLQINLKGLDGIQGPVYVGTGCVFRRQALYGTEPALKGKISKAGCGSCCPSWCCGPRKKGKKNKGKNSKKKPTPARTDSSIPIFNLDDIEEGVEGKGSCDFSHTAKTKYFFINYHESGFVFLALIL